MERSRRERESNQKSERRQNCPLSREKQPAKRDDDSSSNRPTDPQTYATVMPGRYAAPPTRQRSQPLPQRLLIMDNAEGARWL